MYKFDQKKNPHLSPKRMQSLNDTFQYELISEIDYNEKKFKIKFFTE